MNEIVEGLSGVVTSQKAHNDHLVAVLERIQRKVLHSKEKCKFNQTSVKFLGQVLDSTGSSQTLTNSKQFKRCQHPGTSQSFGDSWE